jgi:hypothetical protein
MALITSTFYLKYICRFSFKCHLSYAGSLLNVTSVNAENVGYRFQGVTWHAWEYDGYRLKAIYRMCRTLIVYRKYNGTVSGMLIILRPAFLLRYTAAVMINFSTKPMWGTKSALILWFHDWRNTPRYFRCSICNIF